MLSIWEGRDPEEGLLSPMVILLLIFRGTSILFSIMTVPIYSPPGVFERFCFPTPLLVITSPVDDRHSKRCVVVYLCAFDLHFLNS